jgi:hypothetical protein
MIYMFMSSDHKKWLCPRKMCIYDFWICSCFIFLHTWFGIHIVEFDFLFANCLQYTDWYSWCHIYHFVMSRERWKLKSWICTSDQDLVTFSFDLSTASCCKSLCPLYNLGLIKASLFPSQFCLHISLSTKRLHYVSFQKKEPNGYVIVHWFMYHGNAA